MTISLVNESSRPMSTLDLNTFAKLLDGFGQQVAKEWGISSYSVVPATKRDSAGWNVVIVDKFPNPAMQNVALGYHEVVNGLPIAYIKASAYGATRSIFGTYSPALVLKKITIHGERFTPGLLSVAAHELAEMLIDPNITKLSPPDINNHQWIMEVCDHTVGYWRLTANNVNGVLPDFTKPSFYDLKGLKPYSYLNAPQAPLKLMSGAYGYWKDSMGQIHKL